MTPHYPIKRDKEIFTQGGEDPDDAHIIFAARQASLVEKELAEKRKSSATSRYSGKRSNSSRVHERFTVDDDEDPCGFLTKK